MNALLICLQLRAHYAQYLKRSCSLNKLLLHLFKLMPENPVYPGQGSDSEENKTFFTESLSLVVDGKNNKHTHTYTATVHDICTCPIKYKQA